MGLLWLLGACTALLCVRGQMTLMSMEPLMNNRTNKQIAAVVTGLPILQVKEYGLLDFFREEVMNQRILIFKNQGKISAKDQKKIALYFGDRLDDSHPQHPAATEKEVILVSNDKDHGLTNVGSRGWHMDGYFFEKPHSHCVYHVTSIAKKGPTMFIPLDDIVDALPPETKARWDRIWIRCRIKSNIIHPLIYHHAVTGFETMCIHTDFIDEIIWDHGSEKERLGTEEEKAMLVKEINDEFNKHDGYWHYLHNWEEGDVIITDNLSVGHQAHPDTQLPSSDIGVRVIQRACVLGKHVPKKNPGAPKPASKKLADEEEGDFDDDEDSMSFDDDDDDGDGDDGTTRNEYKIDANSYFQKHGHGSDGQAIKLDDVDFTGRGRRATDDGEVFTDDGDIVADDVTTLTDDVTAGTDTDKKDEEKKQTDEEQIIHEKDKHVREKEEKKEEQEKEEEEEIRTSDTVQSKSEEKKAKKEGKHLSDEL